MPDSNKAIEQNERSKNADNQGQKAPISFPWPRKKNKDGSWKKSAIAKNLGKTPNANPIIAKIPQLLPKMKNMPPALRPVLNIHPIVAVSYSKPPAIGLPLF